MDAWVPRADAVFPNGVTVGRYRIEGIIGRGGMGIVYRAIDIPLDRPVALKCIRPDQAGDADRERKMMREARAASRLAHPNIVRVLEVLDLPGAPGIVMELVEGASLRGRLDAGPIPLEDGLRYAVGLAEALAAAHDKGILHRDINPNNVLLAPDGRALLTDFGLARTFVPPGASSDISTSTDLSGSGALAGTPGYIAPDQLLGKRPDPRSDIFSFGLVLYEMCTGARAFSPDRPDLFDALLHREPVAMGRLNYAVPDELERIVRKAIAKRPDERYQNAGDLSVDLRALADKREWGDGAMSARPRAGGRWIAIGAARWLERSTLSGIPRVAIRQPTSNSASERHPGVSPDGSFVTFAAGDAGTSDIRLLDVETCLEIA